MPGYKSTVKHQGDGIYFDHKAGKWAVCISGRVQLELQTEKEARNVFGAFYQGLCGKGGRFDA